MPGYRKATPQEFDRIIQAESIRDEHEFLESRFFNEKDVVVAKVIRYLDEQEELIPEADLMILDTGFAHLTEDT